MFWECEHGIGTRTKMIGKNCKLYAWIRKSILNLAESLFRLFSLFWLSDFSLSLLRHTGQWGSAYILWVKAT